MERPIVFQYADDIILFLKRSDNLDVRLPRCLLIFSIISGLHVNLQKSSLVGVGMEAEEVQFLAFLFGCQISILLIRYLGF